jgi:ABC-type lipoprotein release transport system permease subunit
MNFLKFVDPTLRKQKIFVYVTLAFATLGIVTGNAAVAAILAFSAGFMAHLIVKRMMSADEKSEDK